MFKVIEIDDDLFSSDDGKKILSIVIDMDYSAISTLESFIEQFEKD